MMNPPGGGQRKRQRSEVIDLTCGSSLSNSSNSIFTNESDFDGAALSDFSIGDRLGARRDGTQDFQGCNSHVFLATFRPRRQGQHSCGLDDNTTTKRKHYQKASLMAPGGGSGAGVFKGAGEGLRGGGFGAWFRKNAKTVLEEGTGARRGSTSTDARDARVGTQWAIKMAFTLVGKDPLQAARDMETEIDILVGGRVPPHTNIMRGVHSFQDDIAVQPVLWAGLEPDEILSPRTFFMVMPYFAAGSLQAFLNKRLNRCKGPPFLRLLEAMRFLEQMLSAVKHLLDHGVAHNDIKPDNWLLCADQRTLVLTDFGECVDALRPPTTPVQPCSSPQQTWPAPPVLHSDTAASVTGQGEAAVVRGESHSFHSAGPVGLTSGSDDKGNNNPNPTAAAAAAAAGTAASAVVTPGGWHEVEEAPAASTTTNRPAATNRFVSTAERSGSSEKCAPVTCVDEKEGTASRGRKRRRFNSDDKANVCWPGRSCGDPEGVGVDQDRSSTELSEKLVFPYRDFPKVGAPSFAAPELARGIKENTVLDYRRSDVFSVGVCMYRMLRPDPVNINTRTGIEEKEKDRRNVSSEDQEAWPLPVFPAHKGGCPKEVLDLCRGLLHPDPSTRHTASEGRSVASWFVSRLRDAGREEAKNKPTASNSGDSARGSSGKMGPTTSSRTPPDSGWTTSPARSRHERGVAVSFRDEGLYGASATGRQHPLYRQTPSRLWGGARANEGCLVGRVMARSKRGAEFDEMEGGRGAAWTTSGRDRVAELPLKGKERRVGEPDELVRCDRISHVRDIYPCASSEDVFHALGNRGWDVEEACAVVGDKICGNQPAIPDSKMGVWFDSVAKELRGRYRDAFSPSHRRSLGDNPRQILPPWKFAT